MLIQKLFGRLFQPASTDYDSPAKEYAVNKHETVEEEQQNDIHIMSSFPRFVPTLSRQSSRSSSHQKGLHLFSIIYYHETKKLI